MHVGDHVSGEVHQAGIDWDPRDLRKSRLFRGGSVYRRLVVGDGRSGVVVPDIGKSNGRSSIARRGMPKNGFTVFIGGRSLLVSKGNIRSDKRTHVFADNLFERSSDTFPWEYLDVLFNVSWLGLGEIHDSPEKRIGRRLVLGDSLGSKTFQVSSDPVLFLDREPLTNDGFEQIQHVDRGDPARVLVVSEYARDDNRVLCRLPLVLRDGTKGDVDDGTFLSSPDLDQSSLGSPFGI